MLAQMRAGLKKTTGCIQVEIVIVDEGAKEGTKLSEDGERGVGIEALPLVVAEAAVPGNPSFYFENVEGR